MHPRGKAIYSGDFALHQLQILKVLESKKGNTTHCKVDLDLIHPIICHEMMCNLKLVFKVSNYKLYNMYL